MGVDCEIGFDSAVPLTERQVANLNGRLREAMGCGETSRLKIRLPQEYEEGRQYVVENEWRFYGPGYERGPWPQIRAVIAWLGANVNGPIYYGGDCDDAIPRFGPANMAHVDAHWTKHGHMPYNTYGSRGNAAIVCPTCDLPLAAWMWEGGRTNFACGGCGYKASLDTKTGVVTPAVRVSEESAP